MRRILVLADDPRYGAVGSMFRSRGIDCLTRSVDHAALGTEAYDLAVIAPGRPDVDDLERMLSETGRVRRVPVMMVVPDAGDLDVNRLYSSGAAVVFTQPVDPLHVFLQCCYFLEQRADPSPAVQFGDLALDIDRKALVLPDAREVSVTEVEARILDLLISRSGRFVPKELISETVFGKAYDKFDRRIDVHISNIRRKLRASGADLTILTSRLGGLKIAAESVTSLQTPTPHAEDALRAVAAT